jgi:hypothetical protein
MSNSLKKKDRQVFAFSKSLKSHFSCERDGQPTFEFDIDSEVLFIYRLIPRMPDFLGWLTIFDTTPIGRFFWGGASRSVHSRIQH